MILVVERAEQLVFAGASDDYLRSVKAGVVEGVHRLTVFEHYIVCDVDDVIYRSDSLCAEPHTQPERRGCDLYVLYDSCCIAEAEVGRLVRYRKVIFHAVARALHDGCVELKRKVKRDRGFAGKTYDREAVGAVRGYLEFHDGISEHKGVFDITADLISKFFAEDKDALVVRTRHIVFGESELVYRAEHTVRFDAAELACLDRDSAGELCRGDAGGDYRTLKDVLRTRDDLDGPVSYIALTYPEVVGILVAGHGGHAGDLYIFNVVCKNVIALDLGTRVGHSVAVAFCVYFFGSRNEFGKPVE